MVNRLARKTFFTRWNGLREKREISDERPRHNDADRNARQITPASPGK
ncbi:MAG: hypothetical protein JWQ50_9266 [Caballeronia mineralivorans]|nr:hypothetical protein [Caballeronia mineralivorans]